MNNNESSLGIDVRHGFAFRGEVVAITDDGRVLVTRECDQTDTASCEVIHAGAGDLVLAKRDIVLAFRMDDDQPAVILGRIGPSHTPPSTNDAGQPPAELVIEATKNLTLRVGAGSITIREDGKILIKGKDLVSHAKRLNRIKGGAVQIN